MKWELFLRRVIIFAVYDASGTEITDPLYTTEYFSVYGKNNPTCVGSWVKVL